MFNPTGGGTRYDSEGNGDYQAPRGSRKHVGRDYLATPGQSVVSPISGTVVRFPFPYDDTREYMGIIIQGEKIAVRLYYVSPSKNIGDKVAAGDVIGTAQDVRKRYGDLMQPHVHFEIESMDPALLVELYEQLT